MSWSVLEALRNSPDIVRKTLVARRMDVSLVDRFLEMDSRWRELKREIDELRHQHNVLSREASRAPPQDRKAIAEKAKELIERLKDLEEQLKAVEAERERLLYSFPNLIHESVPVCPEGVDSIPVRYWGTIKVARRDLERLAGMDPRPEYVVVDRAPVGHADEAENVLGMVDTLKAGEVAGSRFYYLLDDLVWLDFALSLYAMEHLASKGFRPIVPPYM
jgi:seryl-tRNA synthetase (EC 6.1.1.11)